jgi:hypothetical protein
MKRFWQPRMTDSRCNVLGVLEASLFLSSCQGMMAILVIKMMTKNCQDFQGLFSSCCFHGYQEPNRKYNSGFAHCMIYPSLFTLLYISLTKPWKVVVISLIYIKEIDDQRKRI